MNDFLAAIGVLFILGSVIVITKLFSSRLATETSRKIIHLTMGITALSFPFVFEHRMSVVYLGIVAIGALLTLRLNQNLRKGIGSALLGIERKSFGEIYFVISIVVVFVMHKSTYEYLIPMLVLTFADSVAALIGTSYGRNNLAQKQEDAKSSEGSVMFFIVAFICALVPLQLMTEIGRAEVLVISFLIGLLAALIEAVSTSGNDNLLLPLLTYSFLRYNSYISLEMLFANFGIMIFFLGIILFIYKLKNISKLSIAYCLLFGYITMIQGGWDWIIPPSILLLTYGFLPKMKGAEKEMKLSYKVIESNSIIGMICLWVAVFSPEHREILYLAFSFSFACHLCMNTYIRFVNFVGTNHIIAVFSGLAKAVVFIALPTWLITRSDWWVSALYLVLLTATISPIIAFDKKFDYKTVNDQTLYANKILVGALTTIFVIVGGLYLWYI